MARIRCIALSCQTFVLNFVDIAEVKSLGISELPLLDNNRRLAQSCGS